MRFTSLVDLDRLALRALRLPLPPRCDVIHEGDIAVEGSGGTRLLTDTWHPKSDPSAPVVLIRTPYGRDGSQAMLGRYFARHGFRCVVQSCRGTAGSTGTFEPFRTDEEDAHAAVVWLREQSWFAGRLATYGVSYGGYTGWALADDPPPELVGMVPVVAPTDPYGTLFPGGTCASEVALTWSRLMPDVPSRARLLVGQKKILRDVSAAALAMPPVENYTKATGGETKDFLESWFEHGEHDPWWTDLDRSDVLDRLRVPVLFVGAWHDLYTAPMIEQFRTLRRRGVDASLFMMAATHSGHVRSLGAAMPHILTWLHDTLNGDRPRESGMVTVQEVGTGAWHSLPDWPPAPTQSDTLHLHSGAKLAPGPPVQAQSADSFRYDPSDPTPSIGGGLLAMSAKQDNRPLEERLDVLTFGTDVLSHDVVLAGPIKVTLWWECTGPSFDVFVRLLDVAPDDRSSTITDAIRRFTGQVQDRPSEITVDAPPTYCRVARGHRLRLLVSAGAHPRYLRNHGTADPIADAQIALATTNTVHHDVDHPSRITLSTLGTGISGD